MGIDPARRTVLITGASRGIGLETALSLAAANFDVWAGIRNPADRERLHAEGASRNLQLNTVNVDVTSDQSVEEALRTIQEKSGTLDVLVNNAGVTARAAFEEFPESEIKRIFDVNVFGTMRVTRRALPLLRRAANGRIVIVSSIGGRIAAPSVAPYTASKFALEGFGESLYLEVRPLGIHVAIVEPGIVKTGIWDEAQRVLAPARDKASPYYNYFWAGEQLVEMALQSSRLTSADVASAILHAVATPRPRLRYVVGRRASFVVGLRRHLPGELFERLYFGEYLRRLATRAGAISR